MERSPRALRRCRVSAHAVDQQRVEAIGQLVGVASGPKPGVRPVGSREREQRCGGVVEIGAELAELAPFAEERTDPVLVAPALADDLVASLALEVAPLADED